MIAWSYRFPGGIVRVLNCHDGHDDAVQLSSTRRRFVSLLSGTVGGRAVTAHKGVGDETSCSLDVL